MGEKLSNIDLKKLKNMIIKDTILIGYPEGLPHSSGKLDLDEIAKINSESATHPRPFLMDGIKHNKSELKKLIKEELINMLKGKKCNHSKIGIEAVTRIQEFVKGDYYKQNSPNVKSTIRGKTSKKGKKKSQYKDKPLIDTSQTINGLTFVVIKS